MNCFRLHVRDMKIVRKIGGFTDNHSIFWVLVREKGVFTDNLSV